MCRDPKWESPEFPAGWHRVDPDSLAAMAGASHTLISHDVAHWGIDTLTVDGETYFAPSTGRAA